MKQNQQKRRGRKRAKQKKERHTDREGKTTERKNENFHEVITRIHFLRMERTLLHEQDVFIHVYTMGYHENTSLT